SKSRRAALRMLCDDLDANYLTRARNENAKAGNLNNGLAHSKASIVVVFDADHVPFKSFLRETIGHFSRDPKLFLVQTPHVFLNRDPVERNLRTFERMPSENEMFYAVTQRGLDKWNGSFFCGSAAVLRRAALVQVGGFSGLTVTEDCETAFELHRSGWTSVYVDKPLTAGLQPETFESFIGQRSRWCQGMFQLFLMKSPLFKRGLAPIQRVAYLSSMTYWFFPLPRLIFMFAPLLHIFFDVKLFVSTVEESIAYAATYVIVNAMIHNQLYGHVRWPWMSELYEYVQGVHLIKAIASVMVSPRKPTFNVTAKGLSLESDHLSALAWPFLIGFVVLLAGVATAGWRYAFEPGVNGVMLVVGLWALFNLVIAAAALGVVAERHELRKHPRLAVERRGRVSFEDYSAEVEIVNVSAGGCAIRVPGPAFFASCVLLGKSRGKLTIDSVGAGGSPRGLEVTVMRAQSDDNSADVGLKFEIRTASDYLALADLMYGDAGALAKFLTARRRHMGIVRGTLVFLRWSITEPFRAFYYLLAGRRPKIAGEDEPADAGTWAGHHNAAADRGRPTTARPAGLVGIAPPLGATDDGARRAAPDGRAGALASMGLIDPAPVPGR
ncbi:MAG: glycosyltransferase, partial [Xanthobacteraceae bacterium]|nr:glycosyltransferase [Xanthobacteraceae bacterium]